MKKVFAIAGLMAVSSLSAQFKINIESAAAFTPKEVYLYTLSGSKDIHQSSPQRQYVANFG